VTSPQRHLARIPSSLVGTRRRWSNIVENLQQISGTSIVRMMLSHGDQIDNPPASVFYNETRHSRLMCLNFFIITTSGDFPSRILPFVIKTSGSFLSHALRRVSRSCLTHLVFCHRDERGVPVSRILIFIWLGFVIRNSTTTSHGEGSDVVKSLAFSQ
jgi:hypothetical protein